MDECTAFRFGTGGGCVGYARPSEKEAEVDLYVAEYLAAVDTGEASEGEV